MCTRALWSSGGEPGKGIVVVGRNMDWMEDTRTNLWALTRGIARDGMTSGETVRWTSRYGSVVAAMYDVVCVDGVNEKGLAVSGLYLTEADYGERDERRPGLAISVYGQFLLDMFATVAEAVAWCETSDYQVCSAALGSSGKPGTGHIALADAAGDSAIIEFLDGVQHVHHGTQFTTMTNSPPFDQQIAALPDYAGFGGVKPLPGTTQADDRFVRTAYYLAHLPATDDERQAIASVLSVTRGAAQPFGTVDPARPNISATRWSTVADLTDKVYYFESTTSPNIVWVRLDALDFSPGAPALKLDLVSDPDRVGDVSAAFAPGETLAYLPAGGTTS
ncbi:MAG: linear amide C-N hydrolase [Actinobacteria bacterium]|nr:linear amide C-N hydrolase [Actinomycetota bacterium]